MSVKIENLTARPVLLRFNSGRTLHLGSRATSEEILKVELSNKVEKLEKRYIIVLHDVGKRPPAKTRKKASPAAKTKKQKGRKKKEKDT
jgi:hypothetical protein